jgi:hypothetical protein
VAFWYAISTVLAAALAIGIALGAVIHIIGG